MLRRLLFRNLGLKIFSVVIAVLVWFILSGQRRERISERGYRIPLSVVNIPPRTLIASPLPAAVDVRLRGPFTALRQLEPASLEAVVDLLDASTGERAYRLTPGDVNVPQEVEVLSISPQEVAIVLDWVDDRRVPVVPALVGQPAPGQRVIEVFADPRTARVIGPATALARMESVTTDPISVAGRSASFSTAATTLARIPGVRVREGQIVTVTVRLGAESTPGPTPSPGRPAS